MNLGLSLILLAFAHLQPGTLITRRLTSSLLVLTVAFFTAAYGPLLPMALTLMAPVMVAAAGVLVFCGVSAFCEQRQPVVDGFGWMIVAITVVATSYWGFIEPNGHYRAAAFSFATSVINGRSAWLLIQAARRYRRRWSLTLLSLQFVVLTVWMVSRGLILLLLSETLPLTERGANPTLWITVFWYIVLIALITANVIWVEIDHYKANVTRYGFQEEKVLEGANASAANQHLIWSIVTILCLGVTCELLMAWQTDELSIERSLVTLTVAAVLLILSLLILALISTRAQRQRETEAQFLAMLGHELKTPLSAIRLALGCKQLSTTLRVQTLRSVEDMNAIIERCLLANRLRDGRIDQLREPCDIGLLLTAQCANSQSPERISLTLEELPVCHSDRGLLVIVLGNLLDNALKYGLPEQSVSIVANRFQERGRDGIKVNFANAVAPDRLPNPRRLFTQYYRGAWSHETSGSGIGLYLCKQLVQALGGHLRYEAQSNRVNFILWIPL